MNQAGDPQTVPALIGWDWLVEPSLQPKDRHTLQQYEVPLKILDRFRDAVSPYLRARATLLRVIEKQGFRLPGRRPEGKFIDIVVSHLPDHGPPALLEVENENGASIAVGEWIERADSATVLKIPLGE